jgi:hypothetical protein
MRLSGSSIGAIGGELGKAGIFLLVEEAATTVTAFW